jgi:hypothetical protein
MQFAAGVATEISGVNVEKRDTLLAIATLQPALTAN